MSLLPARRHRRTAGALEAIDAIRGVTVGPIENAYHPGVGYGTPAYARTLDECAAMGATWVAITPFGRVARSRRARAWTSRSRRRSPRTAPPSAARSRWPTRAGSA